MRSEGLDKATRGGEWEPIKIPRGNSAYVADLTQCASLQLGQDYIAIDKLLALRIGLES
jgi:hypothetical protein